MLIRRAELLHVGMADVRCESGVIVAIGELTAAPSEAVIDARGGLLLPGLHDHHIHVAALAASLNSVHCGPPQVNDADEFAVCLRRPGEGWLRATGYHESVAGLLDASTLDAIVSHRPLRVQHRSGRMWFFNSAALDILSKGLGPLPLERDSDRFTGRLFDADPWLRTALGSEPPSFADVGMRLARAGVTGLTEISPSNDEFMASHFLRETRSGRLPQRVLLAGRLDLTAAQVGDRVRLGPAKLHLHEADLLAFDSAVAFIRQAHESHRDVAIHCATEVELVFALAALEEAGAQHGDRIEHASVAPDTAIADIARLELAVVSQPHFIRERGDRYREDVEADAQPYLYRLRSFLDAGVTLAAGSDAPFGGYDPWQAMACAVSRRTLHGAVMGERESLTPEQALDLYLRDPERLSDTRQVRIGAAADLCLLDRPWQQARSRLSAQDVRATFVAGKTSFDRDTA